MPRDTATKADVSRLGKEVATYFVDGTGTLTLTYAASPNTVTEGRRNGRHHPPPEQRHDLRDGDRPRPLDPVVRPCFGRTHNAGQT